MSYALLRLLTIIWIAGIVLLSLSPIEVKEAVRTETRSGNPNEQQQVFGQHRAGHYIAFSVGAMLLVAVGLSWRARVALCCGLICLGCTLEWVQHALLGSLLETWDMRDDTVAVVLGFAVAALFQVPRYAPRPQVQG